MLKKLGIASIFQWFVIAVIALAIWKGVGGNLMIVVDWILHAIDVGSDMILQAWDKFMVK